MREKETMVDEIIDSTFGKQKPIERKLSLSLGKRTVYKRNLKQPRKNVMTAVKNPRLKSYHPISLAFIGKYDMKVKQKERRLRKRRLKSRK